MFSDYKFWNPKDTKFDDIPKEERPMVSVSQWPFDRTRWTHVAFTWNGINADKEASMSLYLDGELQGSLGKRQQFTWSVDDAVIMLGINYIGWIDDLTIFNRALSQSEIDTLRTPYAKTSR